MEACISGVRETLPAVDALLSRYATTRLRDYVARLARQKTTGFQDNRDFVEEFANYTSETLGPGPANAVLEDLREFPQVVTANHHGIDTFAQSTQTNLLFSMRPRGDGKAARTVPVLACGSVPLNNLTYPRGLLIYASGDSFGDGGICKLPLFPDSSKRKLVSVAGPFTAEMLNRSRARADSLFSQAKLSSQLGPALDAIFEDLADIGHDFPDYSRQATVVNHRLWRRLFRDPACRSDLVYVELEKIAGRLLEKDLFDQSTICHQLLFDPELRRRLIDNLDGQRGCWQYEKLSRRCSAPAGRETGAGEAGSAMGTMFFWGVDARGRQLPLGLVESRDANRLSLASAGANGQSWTIPFTPEDIVLGLREGRLLPSIFTSYLLISIARGVSCIGGYYQADYLPAMQKAVIETLFDGSGKTVKTVGQGLFNTDLYLSGMQSVGLKAQNRLLPAGPIEIIASGGLDGERYEQMGNTSVYHAHVASLHDIVMDIAPGGGGLNLTGREIASLVHEAVGDKILTISMD